MLLKVLLTGKSYPAGDVTHCCLHYGTDVRMLSSFGKERINPSDYDVTLSDVHIHEDKPEVNHYIVNIPPVCVQNTHNARKHLSIDIPETIYAIIDKAAELGWLPGDICYITAVKDFRGKNIMGAPNDIYPLEIVSSSGRCLAG